MQDFLPRGTTFTRCAMALARSESAAHALDYARNRWGASSTAAGILLKSAVGGATMSTWSELADTRHAAAEFLEIVRPMTILGKLQGLRRVPKNTPFVARSDGAVAYWKAQGKATPVSRGAFDRETMTPLKVAALIVLSHELLDDESPEAEDLVRRDLARACAELSDRTFIDPANFGIAGEMPAAVTFGATGVSATTDLRNDIESAVALFGGSLETASWVLNPRTAVSIGLRAGASGVACDLGARGGMLAGLPAITSEAVPVDSSGALIVLIDAGSVCTVDEGAELSVNREGAVEMTTEPTADTFTPTAASTELVSLFQTDSVGLIVRQRINWKAARADAVVVIEGADYSGGA